MLVTKYRILIIAPSWVGDLVMSQSLFSLLRKKYGDQLILDVFANSWVEDILLRMPEVSKVINNPFIHKKLSLLKRIKLGFQLRKHSYDEAIILPNSFKSAIVPFCAGIKKRIGFIGEFRYGLINLIYKLDKKYLPRMVDRFCALGNAGKKPYSMELPQLYYDTQNRYSIVEKFGIDTNKKLIVFCPAAEYGPSKRWLPSYFAKLADLLFEDSDYLVLLLGSSKDFVLGEEICNQVKTRDNIMNLCGRTKLADTVDLLSLCKVVVTNDSGLMHIACAVATTNVIAIYGSSSPDFTPPLSNKAQIINISLKCSPCWERTCRYGHYNCLKLITPELIYNRIMSIYVKLCCS